LQQKRVNNKIVLNYFEYLRRINHLRRIAKCTNYEVAIVELLESMLAVGDVRK